MNDLWTFTEDWASWRAGQSVYPNAHMTSAQFRGLLDSGKLVRPAEYRPKARTSTAPTEPAVADAPKVPAATVSKVTRPRVTSADKKESVDT